MSFSCRAQLAPLLGQLGSAQSTRMFPLLKIWVLVHAECWYRPASGARLPTAREVPQVSRRDSGFSITTSLLDDLLSYRLLKEPAPMWVVRAIPVLISQGSPRLAPQTVHRQDSTACSGSVFKFRAGMMRLLETESWSIVNKLRVSLGTRERTVGVTP